MRIYRESENPWRCGHWNGSPIEIAVPGVMTAVPLGEVYHYHDFHEYYVVLRGSAMLRIEGRDVSLAAGMIVMVQPRERHRVTWIDPDAGVQWIVIKEQSVPGSKIVVPEPSDAVLSDTDEDV